MPPPIPPLATTARDREAIVRETGASRAAVAIDLETFCDHPSGSALSPWEPGTGIRILALALPDREPLLVDAQALGSHWGPLLSVLAERELVGHHIKFDLLWLLAKTGVAVRSVACTMTASRLLAAGEKSSHRLGDVLERHLGIALPKDQGASDWGGMFLTGDQLRYAADDVRYLHALRNTLDGKLRSTGLERVSQLEMALIPAGSPPSVASARNARHAVGPLRKGFPIRVRECVGDAFLVEEIILLRSLLTARCALAVTVEQLQHIS